MFNSCIKFSTLVAMVALFAGASTAPAAPLLQPTNPGLAGYTVGVDFLPLAGSNFGDITGQIFAVDTQVSTVQNTSTSGCEADDFASFMRGDIALLQRGVCSFGQKANNAIAAGAIAIIVFNEGVADATDVDRLGLFNGTLLFNSPVQVFGTSFATGDALRNGVLSGRTGIEVRMSSTSADVTRLAVVPEPVSVALTGLALAMLGVSRWARG